MQIRLQVIIRGRRQEKGKDWDGRWTLPKKGRKAPDFSSNSGLNERCNFYDLSPLLLWKPPELEMKPQPGKPKQSHKGKGEKVNPKKFLDLNYSKYKERELKRNRNLCEVSTVIF